MYIVVKIVILHIENLIGKVSPAFKKSKIFVNINILKFLKETVGNHIN